MKIFMRCLMTFFLFFATYAGNLMGAPFAYVANFGSSDVTVIDVATNTPVTTIPLGGPTLAAITPDATRVYITQRTLNSISVIDVATNTVIDTIPLAVAPFAIAITPDGSRAYVTSLVSSTIVVINLVDNTVLGSINLTPGSAPAGIAITPDGTKAYVVTSALNSVSVIDLATSLVGVSIPVGSGPSFIAITPDGTRAYVSNSDDNSVTAIDLLLNTPIATIPVSENFSEEPTIIAIAPDGGIAYVINSEAPSGNPGVLSRIDIATNTTLSPILLPLRFLLNIAITPDGTTAYVTNTSAQAAPGFAVPINLATTTLGDSIPVGVFPIGIAITPIPPAIITSLFPTSGPEIGGTAVEITGAFFTGASQVLFGATPATSFVVNSDTSITAISPPGTGTVDVRIVTNNGISAITPADQFTYIAIPFPTIISVTPTLGPETGGTTVSIIGTNFIGTTQVLFGATPATSFAVFSDNVIIAISPPGTGIVDIRVVTGFGTLPITAADRFTYFPLPPRHLKGRQLVKASSHDIVNVLTWKNPKSVPAPAEYLIFRNDQSQPIASIFPNSNKLKFKDYNIEKGVTYTYTVFSVDNFGTFSPPAIVTIKPRKFKH